MIQAFKQLGVRACYAREAQVEIHCPWFEGVITRSVVDRDLVTAILLVFVSTRGHKWARKNNRHGLHISLDSTIIDKMLSR